MKLWQNGAALENLWDALKLESAEFPCVIAVVGSGGKTSLIAQLAEEGKKHHLRVAVTTTTHIRKPPEYQEVFSHMEEGTVTTFGKECGEEKLTYPGDFCYTRICSQADLILVEADGSRGLPVKYPAAHEPVIPRNVSKILCVCGMSGLGKPAAEVCHRWELAQEVCCCQEPSAGGCQRRGEEQELREGQETGKLVTAELLALLLEKGYGEPLEQKYPKADFYYCMNQAETVERKNAAEQILRKTGRKGIVLSLKRKQLAMIYMASGAGSRYGSNKLLETVEGRPLYQHGLEALGEAKRQLKEEQGIEAVLIVVSRYQEILKTAEELQCVPVYNPNSREGITASIHLGIEEADRIWSGQHRESTGAKDSVSAAVGETSFLFAVADQPWLQAETVRRLVESFCESSRTIACLTDGEKNGNPVVFSGRYKEALLELTGDRGGSVIMKKYPDEVLKVKAAEIELRDIDYRMV